MDDTTTPPTQPTDETEPAPAPPAPPGPSTTPYDGAWLDTGAVDELAPRLQYLVQGIADAEEPLIGRGFNVESPLGDGRYLAFTVAYVYDGWMLVRCAAAEDRASIAPLDRPYPVDPTSVDTLLASIGVVR
jgi:hypothetical protein